MEDDGDRYHNVTLLPSYFTKRDINLIFVIKGDCFILFGIVIVIGSLSFWWQSFVEQSQETGKNIVHTQF